MVASGDGRQRDGGVGGVEREKERERRGELGEGKELDFFGAP